MDADEPLLDIFDHSIRSAVTIDSHPSSSQNIELVQDLLEQDQHSRAKEYNLCHFWIPSSSKLRGGISSSRVVRSMNNLRGKTMLMTTSGEP